MERVNLFIFILPEYPNRPKWPPISLIYFLILIY